MTTHEHLMAEGENAGIFSQHQSQRYDALIKIVDLLSHQQIDQNLQPDLEEILKQTVISLHATVGYIQGWQPETKTTILIAKYVSHQAIETEVVSNYTPLIVCLSPQSEEMGEIKIWGSQPDQIFSENDRKFLQTIGYAIGKTIFTAQFFDALYNNVEQNRLLMDASPEPIAVYDTQGRSTYVNIAFVEIFGWEMDELFGKQINFVPTDKIPEIQDAISRGIAGETRILLDTQRYTKDGRRLDVLISASIFRDKNGNINGNISTFRDITKLRRAEAEQERLLKAERRQRLISETLRDVTLALTSKTQQKDILAEILTQVRRIVPYEAAQIVLIKTGNVHIVHTNGYLPEAGRPLILNMVQPIATFPTDLEVIESKKPLIISNTHASPAWVITKETAWIRSYLVAPIMLRNKVIGLVRMDGERPNQFTEIHGQRLMPLASAAAIALENARLLAEEQKRAGELTQARDKALEASRLKTTLLANVSHELRTPLGAVIGYAEMLNAGIYGDITPEQASITTEIVESATYLTHMVNNLLDQAQLESGRFVLENRFFAVTDLVEAVETQLQVLAVKKGLTLTFDIDSNVPKHLLSAPDRLHQIVINLVANAIKFTEEGSVSVRFIQKNKLFWGIQVTDTGIGIAANLQDHIFEPFEQLDNSATRSRGGSGLGLSIVKQLADLMGGHILIKSKLGHGSVFTVHFPITPKSST